MNNSNFFAMMSRMKYVTRWGLMRNTINESLSDHTLDVVVISHALAVIGNTYFGKNIDESRVALLAAFHDAPEIITGDMPTPVKYYSEEVKEAYARVEEAAVGKMLDALPDEMRPHYEGLMTGNKDGNDILHRYVKAADKISALIKCIEEEQMGNKDFARAKESTIKSIEKMDLEELPFFMEHFMPGYYMTLDEQQTK